MAIGTPTERYAQSRTAQGASTTLSPATTIAAGTLAVMIVTASTSGKVVSSVSDNVGGNTWVVDQTFTGATSSLNVSVISCQVVNAISTSATITINYVVTTNNQVHIWIQEITGMASSSAYDKTANGDGHLVVAGTAFTTGNTATLSQADEIVFVGVRATDLAGVAVGSGYTQATTYTLGSTPLSALEYKIVAATTAVSGSMTHSNTSDYAMLLATYEGAASGSTYTKAGFGREHA